MKKQKGQALLLTVMLLAAALTIVLAVSFKSTTETQVTRLEEESQRALAAAEAGVEAALQQGASINDISSLNLGVGFSGNAIIDTRSTSNIFNSPLLQKDEQYTFYLQPYDINSNRFLVPVYGAGSPTVYFGQGGNCPALLVTLIATNGNSKRHLATPGCSSISGGDLTVSSGSYSNGGVSYGYQATGLAQSELSNYQLLIIQVLSPSNLTTQIGLQATANLPLQGSNITSQVTTQGGVTKKVELFQSYPQIPSDFFVSAL